MNGIGPARLLPMAFLLTMMACGAGDRAEDLAADPVETDRVTMAAHYRFAPTVIRIRAGTEVTWSNADDFTHTVRFDNGESGEETRRAAPGESFTITFEEPGEYVYTCSLHPYQMHGKVIVTSP